MLRSSSKFIQRARTVVKRLRSRHWNNLSTRVPNYWTPAAAKIGPKQLFLLERYFYPAFYKDQAGLPKSTDNNVAFSHFLRHGLAAGYSPSPLFDSEYYHSVTDCSDEIPFIHWLKSDPKNRVVPNRFFDPSFYSGHYPDVPGGKRGAFDHYLRRGLFEKRRPNRWFNPPWYQNKYLPRQPHLPAAYHFLFEGLRGRSLPSEWMNPRLASLIWSEEKDANERLDLFLELDRTMTSSSGGNEDHTLQVLFSLVEPGYYRRVAGLGSEVSETAVLLHFFRHGLNAGLSPTPLFDADYYREQLRENDALPPLDAEPSPFLHWLRWGYAAEIVPTLLFDEVYYQTVYPDIARAGVWGFHHFIRHGIREHRNPHPSFATGWYRKNHRLENSKLPAFMHYLLIGDAEGFRPGPAFGFPNGQRLEGPSQTRLETALKLQRPDRIKRRLDEGVLQESITRAEAIEPLVARPRGYRHLSMPPFSSPLYAVAKAVRQSLAETDYEHVVCIPHCRVGGASRVAGELCRALVEIYPDDRLLIVRTDLSDFERPDWFPESAHTLDLRHFSQDLTGPPLHKILLDVLIGVRPKRIFNVNSRLAWEVYRTFGDRLSRWSNLFAYMFCYDKDPEGKHAGYPIEFFESCFDHLSTLMLDNDHLHDYLSQRYCLTAENTSKIVTLWSPIGMTADTSDGAHAVRLENRNGPWRAFWAGRLDRQKRFDLVIDIAKKMPDLEIWAWGHAVLDRGYSTENLPANLNFLGTFEAFEDLPLDQADFWLFTAEWEGLPTLLIDAGVRGMPIVGTRVGGTGALIQEQTAWPVDQPTDVDAYIHAIQDLMAHPDQAVQRAQTLMNLVRSQHARQKYQNDVQHAIEHAKDMKVESPREVAEER